MGLLLIYLSSLITRVLSWRFVLPTLFLQTVLLLPLLFTTLFIQVSLTPAYAQETLLAPSPKATHYSALGNVNLGVVNTIMQTRNGYLWLCTDEGLIRYDGYTAKRYANLGDDPYSLNHNTVMGAVEDNNGNMWISTYGGGLNKFNPQTGQFKKIDLRLNPNDKPASELLYFLSVDENNHLWIGSAKGVMRLDINTEKAIPLPPALAVLPTVMVDRVFIDNKKDLWITSYHNGVFWYDHSTLHHFEHDANTNNSISDNNVRSITQDAQGDIWLGTQSGLNRFDKDKRHFERFFPTDTPGFKINENDINAILSGTKGMLWLGTINSGVNTFKPNTQTFEHITGERDVFNSFEHVPVNHIFVDAQQSMWFATSNGIVLLSQNAQNFSYISNPSATLKTTALVQPGDNTLSFIGNAQYFDHNLTTKTAVQKFADIPKLYSAQIDANNRLWLGTDHEGIYQSTGKQSEKLINRNRTSDVLIDSVLKFYEDDKNQLWISPIPALPDLIGGIYRFNSQTKNFDTFLSAPLFIDIVQYSSTELVMITEDKGLVSLDITQQNNANLARKPRYWLESVPSSPVVANTLIIDSAKQLWVGTRGKGLGLYNADDKRFDYFNTDSGLLSNNIVSIVEDDNHDLWLATTVGLSRFNPRTKEVMNIEQRDGLLFSNFYRRVALKLNNGHIAMATYNGIVMFNPNDIKTNLSAAKVIINDFKLFNQPVALKHRDRDSVLSKPIAYTEQITLSYQQYPFSFGFSAMAFIRPDKRQFAYKMEGVDNRWIYTDATNRIASYTTVPAGDYVFQVKASRVDGSWDDQFHSIKINITPPWWYSTLAYVTYVLLTIGLVLLFNFVRTKTLKQQAIQLKKGIEERTWLLKERADTISELLTDKEQLLSDKDRLFSNVSHEFRTPLTLILNPVQNWLNDNPNTESTRKLTLIQRNGQRLLRLVEQLLILSKLDFATDSKNNLYSLTATLEPIVSSFGPMLGDKNIKLEIAPFDDKIFDLKSDSLELILINLLSNAIKYTPAHGTISITVVSTNANQASIAIKDTGIGISKDDQALIFNRFARANAQQDSGIVGTGIGLNLVKELVEANNGSITLVSETSGGSTFTVNLPLATESQTNSANYNSSSKPNRQENSYTGLEVSVLQNTSIESVLPPVMPSSDQTSALATTEKQTLLLIDDNQDMLRLLHDTLADHFTILFATSGEDGLKQAEATIPDLIICDVMMPGISGFEVAAQLKALELCCHIPVLLLTAKNDIESKMAGWQQDVDEYMVKPFNAQELLVRVNNLLSIRQLLKKRFAHSLFENTISKTATCGLTTKDHQFIERLQNVLTEHYIDPNFNKVTMAQLMFVSERQLHRKLNALYDQGFVDHLRKYRLNQAAKMMVTGLPIGDICEKTGFGSASYFAKYFKAEFGISPKDYQSKCLNR